MYLGSIHASPRVETCVHIHWMCAHSHLQCTCTHYRFAMSLCTTQCWPVHIPVYVYLLYTPHLLYVHICWRQAQVLYMHNHCRYTVEQRFYMYTHIDMSTSTILALCIQTHLTLCAPAINMCAGSVHTHPDKHLLIHCTCVYICAHQVQVCTYRKHT